MSLDRTLLVWANRGLAHPVLDLVLAGVSLAAVPAIELIALVLWVRAGRRPAQALIAALLLSLLGAVGFQALFARARPVGVRLVLPPPQFFSFPSGHAACTVCCALFLSLVHRRAPAAAWLWAALVSGSRVYLGHHYPSDILGGAILGLAAGAVGYGLLCRGSHRRRPGWAWLFWAQAALVLIASLSAYLGLLSHTVLARPGLDKALHLLLFGTLAFTAVAWWARRPPVQVLVVLALLATAEELVQFYSRVRCLDALDLVATLTGVALFGWLGSRARRIAESQA